MAFNWTCPYCNRAQTVTEDRHSASTYSVGVYNLAEGQIVFRANSIGCSNPDCNRLTFQLSIGRQRENLGVPSIKVGSEIFSEQLLPRGVAKPQPDYVPRALVEDYTEACLIRDLSPKASATLTRRCLQGMIRHFANISKSRLIDEIEALKKAVEDGSADRSITPETVEAIDHVRSLGNIGAHMEKDIDLIVPVDPGEAQVMIELIELLFDEWYGARERRAQRLAKIEQIRASKDEIKRGAIEAGAPVGEVGVVGATEDAAAE